MEGVFYKLTQSEVKLYGAGRTDTGVHAKHMVAHFDFDSELNSQIIYQLNSLLPKDISVSSIYEVNEHAHARFDALSRTYEYRISTRKNVFNYDFAYGFYHDLDMDKMNEACNVLLRYKNFQSFSKSNTDVKTYYCDLMEARWQKSEDELIFTIKADRFLRNMVRAIVGTMIEIGQGKMSIPQLHEVVNAKDRGQAGYSVPAHGLYLIHIEYPTTLKTKING